MIDTGTVTKFTDNYIFTTLGDAIAADPNTPDRMALYVREAGPSGESTAVHVYLTPDEAVELATRLLTSARETRNRTV